MEQTNETSEKPSEETILLVRRQIIILCDRDSDDASMTEAYRVLEAMGGTDKFDEYLAKPDPVGVEGLET